VYYTRHTDSVISVPVPAKHRSSGMQEIESIMQDMNAVVDSKNHSEVLELVESAKEKLEKLMDACQFINERSLDGVVHK
jgi:hypothetical protein